MSATLIFVSLAVSLIASVSDTTVKGLNFPRNVTWPGWLLIALAVLTAGINYLQSREKAYADAVESSLAVHRLEIAIYTLMTPSTVISDTPELSQRFQVAASYGRAGAVAGLCDVDISKRVEHIYVAPQYDGMPWAEFITETTQAGLNQIQQVQSVYGRLLDDKTNLLIGEVIAHPWSEFLLAAKGRRIRSNTSRPLCLKRPSVRKRYDALANSYWRLLADLERRVGQRYCALRAQLGLTDVPPLFLRYVSGYFFVPDATVTNPKTEYACQQLGASAGSEPARSPASYP